MNLKSRLRELKYWQITRRLQHFRPWLAPKLPEWLITDALIHAHAQVVRDDEEVGEASFMDIYERWFKEGRH